jgi:hypothetical protein
MRVTGVMNQTSIKSKEQTLQPRILNTEPLKKTENYLITIMRQRKVQISQRKKNIRKQIFQTFKQQQVLVVTA